MKRNDRQRGIAHVGLIVVFVVLLTAVGATFWSSYTANQKKQIVSNVEQTDSVNVLPDDLAGIKTLEEVAKIAGASDADKIAKFTLETKDDQYVYKVTLTSGRVVVINASTGAIISEEKTEASDDGLSAGKVSVSPIEAYQIAASKSSSPIQSIELEVEDDKTTYKIEYKDGSKIEIDASTGSTVKSDIKSKERTKSGSSKQHDSDDDDDDGDRQGSNKSDDDQDEAEADDDDENENESDDDDENDDDEDDNDDEEDK